MEDTPSALPAAARRSRTAITRVLLVVALVLVAAAGLAGRAVAGTEVATDPATEMATAPRVVVIAVPDLLWSDLSPSATPALWALLRQGASGALSVKSRWQLAGCADGLLTLGAGDRAAAERSSEPARPCAGPTPTGASPPAGALAAALRAHGVRTAAIGDGATMALPGADVTGALGAVPPLDEGAAVMVAVDDSVYAAPPSGRAQAVRGVDAQVGALLDPLPPTTTVLLVGSSDRPAAAGGGAANPEAHLHVALARGPGFHPGSLRSPSTKRAPYVELIDVAPTVLSLVGAPVPSAMVGRAWESAGGPAGAAHRADALRDVDVKAVQGAHWRPAFMWALGALALLVAVAALAGLATAGPRTAAATSYACLLVAALPVSSWLVQAVPWWRWSGLVLPALLLAVAAVIAGAATIAGRSRPVLGLVTVTGVSAAVLMADLVTGSRLQTAALLGDSPITAGRFYGAGNTAFGVLAASTLLGTAVVFAAPPTNGGSTSRRGTRPHWARAATAGVVLLAVGAVDAAPSLGADLGGALSYFPSALVLVLLLTGIRPTLGRASAALAAGVILVAAIAVWDYHRPAGRRTHIGDFVAELLNGQAGSVLHRKASANLGQLGSSPFLPLLLGSVLIAVAALRWQQPRLRRLLDQTPGLGPGLAVGLLCAVLGGLLNDSGVTVTGIMLSVAVPTVAALAVRAASDDSGP
ncbi:MAG: hypothetical protein ACJ71T_14875 [Actinomycetales bacterium]